jgi:hypothetical protein
VFGKPVVVQVTDKDRWGRLIGRVSYQGKDKKGKPVTLDLGNELLRAGLAWWYRQYAARDKQLAALEEEARKAKVGLWADAKPIPPWEWRRRPAKDKPGAKPPGTTRSYWLNTATGTRHNSSCRWYRATAEGRFCGPNEGKACRVCGG